MHRQCAAHADGDVLLLPLLLLLMPLLLLLFLFLASPGVQSA
jgi:hypothetical protein